MSDFSRRLEQEIPALRRYARFLARNAERADDLAQDCLERAIAKRWLWRKPDSLRPWLFTVLRNLHLNQLRQQTRRPTEVALDQVFPEAAQAAAQIDRVLAGEVLTALDGLEQEHREVLVLVAVEGLHYKEVAAVLGVPMGTVMSRLSRGRAQLRRQLGGDAATIRRVK